MATQKRHNWPDLKRQFAEGVETVNSFAKTHRIAKNQAFNHAKADGWEAARKDYQERVAKRLEKASEDRAFRTADEIRKRQHRISGLLTGHIEKKAGQKDLPSSEVKTLGEALDTIVTQELVSAGLPTEPERVQVEHTGTIGVGLVVLPPLEPKK